MWSEHIKLRVEYGVDVGLILQYLHDTMADVIQNNTTRVN